MPRLPSFPVPLSTVLDEDPDRIALDGGRELCLGEAVGKGASATVYRARLREANGIERRVAVKLWASIATEESERVLAALLRTARRVACVEHPSVVRVLDGGMWRGRPYMVTELVSGFSLATLHEHALARRQRRLRLDLALFVAAEIAEALEAARVARDHDGLMLGLCHQGLSAREVLLSFDGEVKVSDFEAAVTRTASSGVRSLRGVATRAAALAPEVAAGADGDARSDVFSFGVLLRELLAGPRFPPGLANTEALRLAREGYVQPLTFMPHLPEGIVRVLDRCLAIAPGARYPNASLLAHDLRREVLALGVGDGRSLLREELRRTWGELDAITRERPHPAPVTPIGSARR